MVYALLLVRWAHKNQRLNYYWGITHYKPSDYTRPEFKGELQWDVAKRRNVWAYPNWKRWCTIKPISFLVVLLQTLLLVGLSFALYVQLQDSLENPNPIYDYDILYWAFHGSLAVPLRMVTGAALNGILYGLLIMVLMMFFFMKMAKELGKLENYRTEQEFADQYVLKMFFFIFVDGYMMFWILGLYHIPLATYWSFDELTEISVAGVRLFYLPDQLDTYMEQLSTVCITAIILVQLLTLLLENVVPFVIKHYVQKARAPTRALLSPRARFLQEVCDEAERDSFDLFGDYYDCILFLGYGTIYSLLWPLAPLVNWANNMLETRHDVTKFTDIFRRPVPRKVGNIGMWEKCAWFQCYTTVVQISLVAAFGTRLLDVTFENHGLSPEQAPTLWVSHPASSGEDGELVWHVAPYAKGAVCAASSLCGFALILLVRAILGPEDVQTKIRLERDDYVERKGKVRAAFAESRLTEGGATDDGAASPRSAFGTVAVVASILRKLYGRSPSAPELY